MKSSYEMIVIRFLVVLAAITKSSNSFFPPLEVYFSRANATYSSIHIIKQSPPPRLSVCLSAGDKLENSCTDFYAVFTNR